MFNRSPRFAHRALEHPISIALLLLVILVSTSKVVAQEPSEALRLASDPWPPFTDEEGRPRVAIQLVEIALQRAGLPASTTVLGEGFGDILVRIEKGDFDGSAALWKTPEREAFLRFSVPYLENRLVLVGREGSPVNMTGMAELSGKRVATVSAYAYGQILSTEVGPEFVRGESDESNLRKLLDGEVDYVLADELLIHHLFRAQPEQAEGALEVGRFPLVSRKLHFALRKAQPDSKAIIAAFDKQIRAMMTDGTFHRALDVDWLWVDIDGDGAAELVLGGTQAGVEAPSEGYGPLASDPAQTDAAKPSRYVVEGVVYDEWQHVPDRYKVDIDRTRAPVDPIIPIIRF